LAAASEIIAVDPVAEKLTLARDFGATKTVMAKSSEAVPQVRDFTMGGADFVFDCIGLPETVSDATKMLGVGGCAVLVGLPAVGESSEFSPYDLTGSEQRILGSYYGSSRPKVDFPILAELYLKGRLKIDELVTSRRPLEEVEAALDDLRAGRGIKTVLEPSPQRVPV
jgi:S-(hydroxymethyl)glutathione dehydrogenase/alcohol dehydrogenase